MPGKNGIYTFRGKRLPGCGCDLCCRRAGFSFPEARARLIEASVRADQKKQEEAA